jgi:perosamine synthetase
MSPESPTDPLSDQNARLPAVFGRQPIRPEGPPGWPLDDPAVAAILQECYADGTWSKYHGPYCERLTERLKTMHDCEHAVLCASGTAAIELALRGLKIGPGDEVILAAYDFKGNIQDVLTVGATPVLVDIDPQNGCLDVTQIEAACSEKTKAIIATHLHGGIVDMPRVVEFAKTRSLTVIEDACQMPGATVHGKIAGTWGDVGVHSFGGSKLLGAGRGGAFVTNSADIVQRARLYSHRGNESYPLSELQAAVLLPQLNRLDERNKTRTANVAQLCNHLANVSGITPLENSPSDSRPGYYKLGLRYDASAFAGLSRDLFADAMQAEGIAVHPGFRALHRITSLRRFRAVGDLPHATLADETMLVFHHPVLLGDNEDLLQVVAAIEKIREYGATIVRSD